MTERCIFCHEAFYYYSKHKQYKTKAGQRRISAKQPLSKSKTCTETFSSSASDIIYKMYGHKLPLNTFLCGSCVNLLKKMTTLQQDLASSPAYFSTLSETLRLRNKAFDVREKKPITTPSAMFMKMDESLAESISQAPEDNSDSKLITVTYNSSQILN